MTTLHQDTITPNLCTHYTGTGVGGENIQGSQDQNTLPQQELGNHSQGVEQRFITTTEYTTPQREMESHNRGSK